MVVGEPPRCDICSLEDRCQPSAIPWPLYPLLPSVAWGGEGVGRSGWVLAEAVSMSEGWPAQEEGEEEGESNIGELREGPRDGDRNAEVDVAPVVDDAPLVLAVAAAAPAPAPAPASWSPPVL